MGCPAVASHPAQVYTALFNIMGIWPIIYSALLVPAGRSANKVSGVRTSRVIRPAPRLAACADDADDACMLVSCTTPLTAAAGVALPHALVRLWRLCALPVLYLLAPRPHATAAATQGGAGACSAAGRGRERVSGRPSKERCGILCNLVRRAGGPEQAPAQGRRDARAAGAAAGWRPLHVLPGRHRR